MAGHHFVSKCYLKNFAVPTGRKRYSITVFDAVDRKTFRTSTENVALEHDFNRVEIEGTDANAVEDMFAKFESELGPAIKRIDAAASLDDQRDRSILIEFICLLSLRNPRLRETIDNFQTEIAKRTLHLMTATPERWAATVARTRELGSPLEPLDYETAKKAARKGQFKAELVRSAHIGLEFDNYTKILPYFFERRWLMLKAPQNTRGFITSDHPPCLAWSDPSMRSGVYGPGLGLKGTEIYFPVTQRLAVVGAFEIKNGAESISEETVAGINGAQVAYARRQVYAADNSFWYSLQPNEIPRKGADLPADDRFVRKAKSGPGASDE